MIISYTIEIWNRVSNRYIIFGKYNSLKQAETMMFKPYMLQNTRRLIKTSEETLYKEKSKSDD